MRYLFFIECIMQFCGVRILMQITRAKVTSDDGFVIVNKDKGMTSHDVVSLCDFAVIS